MADKSQLTNPDVREEAKVQEKRTIITTTKPALVIPGGGLKLNGSLRNMLQDPLRIVNPIDGCIKTTYPLMWHRETNAKAKTAPYIKDSQCELSNEQRRSLRQVERETKEIGYYNENFIPLVRPLHKPEELCELWRCEIERGAVCYGLPDMDIFNKASLDYNVYCVVNISIALAAFYQGIDITHLLVPARPLPVRDMNGAIGYSALMPAACLVIDFEQA